MRGIVAALALRFIACVGVLVGALLMGDSGSGLASADSGGLGPAGGDEQFSKGVNNDGVGAQTTMAGVTGEPQAQSANSGGSPHPPETRVGSGREPSSPHAADPGSDSAASGGKRTLKRDSNGIVLVPLAFLDGVALPVPALPNGRGSDLAQDAARVMSTLEAAVTPYLPSPPQPQPTPSPSFRTQQEEQPAPAAATGTGGSDATAFGGVADLPVLEAPVLVAPRISGLSGIASPVPPAGATSGAVTPRMAGAEA
ncbi:MAG: hypothetical protein ACRDU5_03875, partial [Mycobacterium sp.]